MKKIELLAPAKNLELGKIAVDYGADAIYVGAPKFGARKDASNSIEEIAQLVEYAHKYGVGVYGAFNTVIYEKELEEAQYAVGELIDTGVDALIIQDMGVLRMGLEQIELHASTQTTNISVERVKFLEKSGFSRVILERGLTLEQIREIAEQTDIELECFVHGAICVGYSGRCYLSRSMGERSGNRGECNQACRLSYDLVVGEDRVLMRGKHLLSVQDLDLSNRVGELLDAGVTSLKIEGRLKDEDYVKNIVAHYRKTIDEELAKRGEGWGRSSDGRSMIDFTPQPQKTFSRSAGEWMIDGKRGGVASFDTPKAMGEYVGQVVGVAPESFTVKTDKELNAGDGVCFVVGGALSGTNINRVVGNRLYPNRIEEVEVGVELYRNFDHKFQNTLKQSRAKRVIDIDAQVRLSPNQIQLRFRDVSGVEAMVESGGEFEPAQKWEQMLEMIKKQVAKSGDTIFAVQNVDIVVAQDVAVPFIPQSVVSQLRREGLQRLEQLRLVEFNRVRTEKNRDLPKEERDYPYPTKSLGGDANVLNSLSEQFYQEHGVESVERGFDAWSGLWDVEVMRSAYCIRREIGECLVDDRYTIGADQRLMLRRGSYRYALEFDCKSCEMSVRKLGGNDVERE